MIAVVPEQRRPVGLGLSDQAVLDEYMGHVHAVISKLGPSRLAAVGGMDDAIQIGVLALLRAAKGFEPSYMVPFGRYAVVAIWNSYQRALRDSNRWDFDRIPDGQEEAIDDRPWFDDLDVSVVLRWVDLLPPSQRMIVRRRHGLDGNPATFAEIAIERGRSRQSVQQAYVNAINTLRQRLKVQES